MLSDKLVLPRGSENPYLYIVGEAPGETEEKEGEPFIGLSGKLLTAALEESKIGDYRINNAVPYRPFSLSKDGKKSNRTPTDLEIEEHSPQLINDIIKANPKFIIALGASAIKALKIKDYTSIGSLRDKEFVESEIESLKDFKIIASYHPAYVLRKGGRKSKSFMELVNDLLKTNIKEEKIDLNKLANDFTLYDGFKLDEVDKFVSDFDDCKKIILDYETSGLDIYTPGFGLAGISVCNLEGTKSGYLRFYDFDSLGVEGRLNVPNDTYNKITEFFKSRDKIIVYNASYEINVTRRFFPGVEDEKFYDVMSGVIAFFPREGSLISYSLKNSLPRLCKNVNVSSWTGDISTFKDKFFEFYKKCLNLEKEKDKKDDALLELIEMNNESDDLLLKTYTNLDKPFITYISSITNLSDSEVCKSLKHAIDIMIQNELKTLSSIPYTFIPYQLCAPYAILDCLSTAFVLSEIKKSVKDYKKGGKILDIYNKQSILCAELTRNGLSWDDNKAEEINKLYIEKALRSLKDLIMKDEFLAELKNQDKLILEGKVASKGESKKVSDYYKSLQGDDYKNRYFENRWRDKILQIQSTADIEPLKEIFNPGSNIQVRDVFMKVINTKLLRFVRLFYKLKSSYIINKDETKTKCPFLTSIYEEFSIIEDRESRLKYVMDILADGESGNSKFIERMIESKANNNFSKEDEAMLKNIKHLTSGKADVLKGIYKALCDILMCDLNDRETWVSEFEMIYYFKVYKKINKMKTSYIDNKIGRASVDLVKTSLIDNNEFPLSESKYSEREISDNETYMLRSFYLPNTADTKRWKSGVHTIPKKTELLDIRIPKYKDGIRIKWDYSQMEVVTLAFMCQDESILSVIRRGDDIHRYIASKIFNMKPEEVTDEKRTFAKGATFSILYGSTIYSFANTYMNGDMKATKDLFKSFFSSFPKIKEWINNSRRNVINKGHCNTLFGDKVPVDLPLEANDLSDEDKEAFVTESRKADKINGMNNYTNQSIKAALRYAQNYPIQSTASNIAAIGLYETTKKLKEEGIQHYLDCFIHDSGEISLKNMSELPKTLIIIKTQSEDRIAEIFDGVPYSIDLEISYSGNHSMKLDNVKVNENILSFKFNSSEDTYNDLFARFKKRGYGIKIISDDIEKTTKNIDAGDLFSENQGFNFNFGSSVNMVAGEVEISF